MHRQWIRVQAAFLFCVITATVSAQRTRSAEVVSSAGISAKTGFDPAQSAALFVGIREFTHDSELTEVRYAVDDAIDLAFAFSLERPVPMVDPSRIALALSGEPQKPSSRERLEALRAAHATIRPAGHTDILQLLERQTTKAGKEGMLIVSIATHGFTSEGVNYLLASNSLLRHRQSAVSTTTLFEIIAGSDAPRSLVFLDTCRKRMTSGTRSTTPDARFAAPLIDAVARASGQAVLYAAASGHYAYDDDERKNGVFTAAVLDGLHCSAPADERGLITVSALADYVNDRVLAWVRTNRERNASKGISVTIDGGSKKMAIAVCLASAAAKQAEAVEPALVRADANTFTVMNANGVPLWGTSLKGIIANTEIADLDGDGRKEVIAGVTGTGEDVGKIFVFETGGRMRWSADTTVKFNYDSARSGRLSVVTFATGDLDRNGTRQIVVLSIDSQGWYPARLTIFNHGGALMASYWHPGHLHRVVIGAPAPKAEPRIIVTGLNNDLRRPRNTGSYVGVVLSLDPKNVRGEAPPYYGNSTRGTELWYATLGPGYQEVERLEIVDYDQDGRSEISVWTKSGNVFYISFAGELLTVAQSDGARTGAVSFQRMGR